MSLIQRFSIVSLIAMVLFCFAIAALLGYSMEKQMLSKTVKETADIIHQNIVKHFKEDQLLIPMTGKNYHLFANKISHLSLGSAIEKIEIWNSNMTVIWASNKEIVGKKFPHNLNLKKAFKSGKLVYEIEVDSTLYSDSHNKNHIQTEKVSHTEQFEEHGTGLHMHNETGPVRLLELYVPLKFSEGNNVNIVFEVYKNMEPLYASISGHKRLIWIWTLSGFSCLCIVLFTVVWKASRRIDKQTREIIQSRQDWEKTFDSITDMITIHDLDCNIIRHNKSAGDKLGLAQDRIKEKCCSYIHGSDAPPEGCAGKACAEKGKPSTIEIFEPHLMKYIEIRAIPRLDNNGILKGLIHVVRDITERKRHEMEQDAIVRISTAVRNAPTRNEMIKIVLDQIISIMNVEGALLISKPMTNGELIVEVGRGSWANWTGGPMPLGEEITCDVSTIGQPFANNEFNTTDTDNSKTGNLSAVACVPLLLHKHKIGIITVGRSTHISGQELRLLTTIADIAANAIHRVTLHETTEKRVKRMAALHSIDMAISSSLDLEVTLNIFMDQVTTQLEVDAASVLLINHESQLIEYAAGRGFRSQSAQAANLRVGESLAGRAAMMRSIVKVPDVQKLSDDITRRKFLRDEGIESYYASPLISKGQVMGVLEVFHRNILQPDEEWFDFMETLSVQAAIAIDNAHLFLNLQRTNLDLKLAYDSTLEGWSRALDMRDKVTEGHTRRVTEMTVKIAKAMGIRDDNLVHIRRGAMLHDIGKMGIPDNILSKPGKLTSDEWKIMRQHPVYAYQMLSPIAFLRPAIDIPYCHHEMWDGNGYPRGLKGDQIPLEARIFSVVDVWDALRSDRPYRKGWDEEKVREHIKSLSGTHFDPNVIEAFIKLSEKEYALDFF